MSAFKADTRWYHDKARQNRPDGRTATSGISVCFVSVCFDGYLWHLTHPRGRTATSSISPTLHCENKYVMIRRHTSAFTHFASGCVSAPCRSLTFFPLRPISGHTFFIGHARTCIFTYPRSLIAYVTLVTKHER
jgi:hypothetical protein